MPGAQRVRLADRLCGVYGQLSQRDRVYQYIRNQEEHHRKRSFAEEMAALLAKYGANAADILDDSAAPEGAQESEATLTHS